MRLPIKVGPNTKKTKARLTRANLTEENGELIRTFFAKDFELFGCPTSFKIRKETNCKLSVAYIICRSNFTIILHLCDTEDAAQFQKRVCYHQIENSPLSRSLDDAKMQTNTRSTLQCRVCRPGNKGEKMSSPAMTRSNAQSVENRVFAVHLISRRPIREV